MQFTPGVLLRLLLRTEGLPGCQGVVLPTIDELRPFTPLCLLEQPVTDPFALGPHRR